METPQFAGPDKCHEIKIMTAGLKSVETIAFVTDINYLAVWTLAFKFAGERQERGYVAAGAAPRQDYGWCWLIH